MNNHPRHAAASSCSTDDHPMARLLDQYAPASRLKRGQIVKGTIVRVGLDVIVVDVGAKCEGTISGRELEKLEPELVASLKPGDEVSVYIVNPEGPCGEVVLSLARARQEEGWRMAAALLESKEVVELEVTNCNRGGLIVRLGATRGFVPASQLAPSRGIPRMSDPSCQEALTSLVGSRLQLQVIEADREKNRLILSERAALARRRREEAHQLLASLQEGDVRRGTVSNLTHFGAFVDLGGLDGLLHVSEISWQPVGHPGDVLEVGQEVEVMVLSVDRERQQVALSMKRLEPDPWATVGQRYQVGQLVRGRITRLTKWGAFARIVGDEAIEGLIHVSELDEQRVVHPRDVVQPGEVLTLRVVRLEPERHRMALSRKQVVGGEEADVDWRADLAAASHRPSVEGPMASASHRPSVEGPMASAFDRAMRAGESPAEI